MTLVTLADIRAAHERIGDLAVRTPLLPAPWAEPGRPLWLKPENLQPTGAFKVRGAGNAVARVAEAGARGVVTDSSGNHGQALAYAARRAGLPAVVVMPDVAPAVKVDATRRHGAEIVFVPPADRVAAAHAVAAERGYAYVPPYDHPDVIAGQGTVGLEIAADLAERDAGPLQVLVPVGGGGLVSGTAAAVRALYPGAVVVGVEPELAADAQESLRRGELVRWEPARTYRTIADGVRTNLSPLTFAHLQALVDRVVTVTEDEILAAMRTLATGSRLVAEPSGAVATAAYLYHRDELPEHPVSVAVVSGGNVDPDLLATTLAR